MGASPLLLGRPPRFSKVDHDEPCVEHFTAWPWFKLSVFGELGLNNRGCILLTFSSTSSPSCLTYILMQVTLKKSEMLIYSKSPSFQTLLVQSWKKLFIQTNPKIRDSSHNIMIVHLVVSFNGLSH